jgi:hypothetical protein
MMKDIKFKAFYRMFLSAGLSIAFIGLLSILIGCRPEFIIDNPYENVNWEEYGRYKSDLHVHTNISDGDFTPQHIVDLYHSFGYTILAISDHDVVVYPWQEFTSFKPSKIMAGRFERGQLGERPHDDFFVFENRDPESLGMIAIQANEVSSHYHIGSYFCDHPGGNWPEFDGLLVGVDETLEAIAEKGGLAVLMHPGRHGADHEGVVPVEWYYDVFQRYDHLIGLEAYNSGLVEHQPGSIHKWDSVLTYFMPDRPVWGFSHDDFHNYRWSVPDRNFNIFLLPKLSVEEVRSAMENGVFYHVAGYERQDNAPPPPEINSIKTDSRKGTIHIEASNYEFIEWISDGSVVHVGDHINISELPDIGNYVRANIYQSKDGVRAGTQPFGISKP